MNKPLTRMTALALGCVVSISLVGCARNAVEPPTQVSADTTVQPAPIPAAAPEVMAVAPQPVVTPAPVEVAPRSPDVAMPAPAPMTTADPAPVTTTEAPLPPQADRN